MFGTRNPQPCLNFSFIEKDKQFQPVSHSVRLLCLFFYTQYLSFWE